MFHFIADGDPQFGRDHPRKARGYKRYTVRKLKNIKESLDFVIIAGDLTEDGHRHSSTKWKCFGGVDHEQYDDFVTGYLTPIESLGVEVKLCHGNHDGRKEKELIRKRHGNTYYFFCHKGVVFVCMGEKPSQLDWLRNLLNDYKGYPFILYFHYNLEGSFSDFWSSEEKEAFFNVIKDASLLMIITGHIHSSVCGEWRGIPTLSAAGSKLALITVDLSVETPIHITWF